MLKKLNFTIFFLLSTLWCVGAARAQTEIPPLTGPVMDEVGILSPYVIQNLQEVLRENQNSAQVQIWIIPSLKGEAIESLSIRAVDKWKLGTQNKDNGLLVLVAIEDRKMRIEVGQGLEGDIPDALTGRWIDRILRPAFRQQKYSEGFVTLINEIFIRITGEPPRELEKFKTLQPKSPIELPLIVIFVVVVLVGTRFRRRRFFTTSGWSGGNWPGRSSSTFGGRGWGGGGWSGGGGGFSGGGSSGSW